MHWKKSIFGATILLLCVDAVVLTIWVRPFIGNVVSANQFAWPQKPVAFYVSVFALLVWGCGWLALYAFERQIKVISDLRSQRKFKVWSIVNSIFAFALVLVIVLVRGNDFLF